MPSGEYETLKGHFIEELGRLDPKHDTFAVVLGVAQSRLQGPAPRLRFRETTHLHGLYLNALSETIRRAAVKLGKI